ncbi:MAG: beta-1,6-N-acetylglucosaminyltransferase [Gaiellaceae bacterium]
MRLAYIVSAYKRPEQLGRLVRRLHPAASIAIHVDAKTSERVYAAMVAGTAEVPGVTFLPRHVCRWGSFGHVRASLKGIADLVENKTDYDYAILLTGQDYPLTSTDELAGFFERAGGRSFMSHWRLPFTAWSGRGGLDRIENWHLVGPARLHLRAPLRRRAPAGLRPSGGSPYWCLARPLVEYVYRLVALRPEIVRFFEHVYIPDELFFQTILASSPHAETIANENLRYIDWSVDPGPKVLTVADLPAIVDSGKLFARKFDVQVDSRILDALDASSDTRLPAVSR